MQSGTPHRDQEMTLVTFHGQHGAGVRPPQQTPLVLPLVRIGATMLDKNAHRPYSDLHARLEEQALSLVRIAYPGAQLLHRSMPGLLVFSIGPLRFWLNEDDERPCLVIVPEPTCDVQMRPHSLQMDDNGLTDRGLLRLVQCVTGTTLTGRAYNRTNLQDDAFTAHYGYTKAGGQVHSDTAEQRRTLIDELFRDHHLTPLSTEALSPAC